MSNVLVIVEGEGGELRPWSREAIGAALSFCADAGGEVLVGVVADEPSRYYEQAAAPGVKELVGVPVGASFADPLLLREGAERLIEELDPELILIGQSARTSAYAPAIAARGGYGFASDVTELWREGDQLSASRPAYGGKLSAELTFDGKPRVLLLLRQATFAAPEDVARVPSRELEAVSSEPVTELLGSAERESAEVDIQAARFLISVGRGIEDEGDLEQFAELASRSGATLCASRPLVDAGWVSPARQVGQSGKSVEPDVYLAFGISGAVQHLAGIAGAGTVIAVNTDPSAPIFSVADYGAVADMFDVAAELGELLG